MLYIVLIFLILIAINLPLIILKNKVSNNMILKLCKIFAIVLFLLATIRCFLSDGFIWVINGGVYGGFYYKDFNLLQSLLRWGLLLSIIVYPCASFFKNQTMRNVACYFCLPVCILCVIFYNDFLRYFTEYTGRGIWITDSIRHIEFIIELTLAITIPLLLLFRLNHKFKIKDCKEWLNFFLYLPLMLIVVVPVTLPQSIWGFTDKFMLPLSFANLMWVLVIFLLFIFSYFLFRFKSREIRYMVLIFLSLFLFLHYNSIYLMDLKLSRLPFQLCNLGSYLILIALLIKKQGFFDFILIANVTGAMIAFLVPDTSEGMLSFWNIHFYIEHTWVFVIPILAVALRIMPRPAKNSVKNFLIGFSIYFLTCAVLGVLFNAYLYDPASDFYNKVNYFYIFDTTVLEILPFLRFTRLVPIYINGYTFYPLYMLVIYVLFVVLCLIVNYVYIKLCKLGDDFYKLRQIRIDLFESKGKYKKKIPKRFYDD